MYPTTSCSPASISSSPESSFASGFRRRGCGRAHSPPTWAWYEQIPPEDYDEDSMSGSDDDSASEDEDFQDTAGDNGSLPQGGKPGTGESNGTDIDSMEIDGIREPNQPHNNTPSMSELKGKQRVVESDESPEPSVKKPRRRKQRQPVYPYKPILTIMSSQGFVWNQDLFVPSYIKDRYVASTSPPSARIGFFRDGHEGEVEVVEIRVTGKELDGIIP